MGEADAATQYVASFRARAQAVGTTADHLVDGPGLVGVVGSADRAEGRLLVTNDRAYAELKVIIGVTPVRLIVAMAAASRCIALIDDSGRYHREEATAMVCRDLAAIAAHPLPNGLTLRAVRRTSADPSDGVPLALAAAACMKADPEAPLPSLEDFVAYLAALPEHAQLLAATDSENLVRATAASMAVGTDTGVFFVSTDTEWRGRGVGTAMTVAALHSAMESGATTASLDASPAGLSIYRRLGFESVGPIAVCFLKA